MTFTLPKWAALIVYLIIWPGLSTGMCVWMLIDSNYNWAGVAAGAWASVALREAIKLKRTFFDD
nr:MAG TPA: hypothetical protein [Caudoviricetes sp.]